MPSTIPIRKLVLYKHGVATVIRQGRAEGEEISLQIGAGELDDVLKSLTAWTLDGGQVSGIQYVTPTSADGHGASIPLHLGSDDAFFALLRGLRGIAVTLKLEGAKTVQGRVIGVEQHPQGRKHGAMLILMTTEGSVEQIASDRIVQMRLDDERASRDLSRYLDAAVSAGEQRALRIALTEPDREVRMAYTVPNPVWRVSYRVVADSADSSCLVQGWAILDNRFDEDLEEVEVSLVAGQPVSFRYDLTSSVTPERRVIRDEARIAAAPVEFESLRRDEMSTAAGAPEYDTPAFMRRPSAPAKMLAANIQALDSQALSVETSDLHELFEYGIGNVSVRRGDSSMAPIVQHRGTYRRELLYNGQKHPTHPVVSLRMRNDSGLTLERGPATIFEDGDYRGEAIMPFAGDGSEVVLAYAVELGIRVIEQMEMSHWVSGIDLKDALLHIQEYEMQTTSYALTNDTAEEKVITVERGIWGDLSETREPDEQNAEYRRWSVPCPSRAVTRFVVAERLLRSWHEHLADESMAALARYLEETALDEDVRRKLADILLLRQMMARIDSQLESLREENSELASRQERLRRNLSIQPASEEEAEIRRRSSVDFGRTQDREDEIIAEIERLTSERDQAEVDLERALAAV